VISYLVIFGPAIAFVVLGYALATQPGTRWSHLVAIAIIGTLAWLLYVALVPHVEGGNTVFGRAPVLKGENDSRLWLFPLFVAAPVAYAGWRRSARSIAIAAAATVGPLAFAWPTTPRGDNDGLWALIFIALTFFGLLLAALASAARAARAALP
jgi:hypothetical protein